MKLPDDNWSLWAESFLAVFGDRGWSKVSYAFAYKYISGSLVDYALKKERMIPEIEKGMTMTTRINLIVVGLPENIRNKLDKEEIRTTDQLFKQLGRYENGKQRKEVPKEERAQGPRKNIAKQSEKKPCGICESLKLYNRFHPAEKCFNKDRRAREKFVPKKTVNLNEASGTEDQTEYQLEDEKNE